MKALLGVWILALAAAAGWIGWDAWQGDRPAIGGSFALTDQDGRTVTSDSLKGKPTLIYFGFTYCPDVCPTSLLLMETALEKLGPDAAKKVNLVFITIDPTRDTPKALKAYLASFGPQFVGLTGDATAIKKVAGEYRVYYAKHPLQGGGYAMDHSSELYLLGPNGKLTTFYDAGIDAKTLAADLDKRV